MHAKIVVLPGDGLGPEVTAEAVNVLKQTADCFGHAFHFEEFPIGRVAQKAFGTPLPESTLEAGRKADAVLLGALDIGQSPDEAMFHAEAQRGLITVERALGMLVSLRPVRPHPALHSVSPLREQVLEGVDILIVRSLCGGIPNECDEDTVAIVADAACRLARTRRHHVTAVDRAMTSDSTSLWRTVPTRIVAGYPDVQLDVMPVDVCLQQMLLDPPNLDVIVTDNMLGAALANQAVALVGAPALLPSGARGLGHLGVYASTCGPMFDQAGVDAANPIGAILAAAMMLRHTFSLEREAAAIEYAVDSALGSGMRTADIALPGERVISTHAMGEAIAAWVCQKAGQSQRSLRAEE
jgi:3-isopropylmalate dehydrogenase